MVSDTPSIPEFYRGGTIFITGGSGFMGKVLIEKLLRSCPELDTIYLLLRPKKGKEAAARIADIINMELFDRIRKENPGVLGKLVAVAGDVKEIGLGLSEADRRMLQDQVTVIFHSAASVRFDDPIREAVLMNVRGTREVVDLALGMRNLKVMLHVSTMYCQFDKYEVLEEIYPAPGDWRTMIELAEGDTDESLLRCLTPKIIGSLPNTYTYTKALSEHIINDYRDRLPLVIVRPSIVMPAWEEPIPGWLDNVNGPIGIFVAGGLGVLRSYRMDGSVILDYVMVDTAIKSFIYLAWHRAQQSEKLPLKVYNCCSMMADCTMDQFMNKGTEILSHQAFENTVWYPKTRVQTSRLSHYLHVIILHVLPFLLLDAISRIKGGKPMLMKLQRRIYNANELGVPFCFIQTHFRNTNFLKAHEDMKKGDEKEFTYNKSVEDLNSYITILIAGLRLYILKQPTSSVTWSVARFKRLYWYHQILRVTVLILIGWIFVAAYNNRFSVLMTEKMDTSF